MKSSTSLATTQACFQDYVLDGEAAIDQLVEGGSAQFRESRLGIYRDAYRLRLIEVLGNDFEILRTYVGDQMFDALARAYISAHPSTFRNVRWFGGKLAQFLRATAPYSGHPEVAELAQFEWCLGEAFDAQDIEAVRFEDVVSVAPEDWANLRFQAQPALRVLVLRTNAVAIWKSLKESSSAVTVELSPQPVTWAVWRKQLSPFFRSLEADEAWALQAMMSGARFGEICTGVCGWVADEAAAAKAAGMLRTWVEAGWIVGLRVAG